MNRHLTKITAPKLRKVVPRDRLFSILDDMNDTPVTWLSSQAGSGKTTLLASYLDARSIPYLWYRVDEADSDVASFFYYMGEAAKGLRRGRNRPLPLFTPEYRLGISAFTRHYFESLFERLKPPFVLVFDNYQDAPEGSRFHEVIKAGLSLAPEGIRILVASRKDYPSSFVSLKAGSLLNAIGWEDIRFTLDEVREMIRLRSKTLSEDTIRTIHSKTKGWAVAAILMSEQDLAVERPVFDYFAVEVFHKLNPDLKDFLLKTSILPSVSPEIAAALTGVEDSEAILSSLRGHYFTERYGKDYAYHQLFREFLLSEVKKTYDLTPLTVKAGKLLAGHGRTEEAVKLLLNGRVYTEALPLILGHAKELLRQGRGATLEEWASRLPESLRDHTPWLSYWLGMGGLVTDATSARGLFEKAFTIFESQSDQTGCLLSAAAAINAIVLEWDDYRPIDRWVDWIEKNVDLNTPLPAPEMDAAVASAMVCGLSWRKPWHPDMNTWIERTLRAAEQVKDPVVRFMAKGAAMDHYCTYGHYIEMHQVAEEFRHAAFSPNIPPLAHLAYMIRIIHLHDWINGTWEDTLKLIENAILMAEEMGAYSHLAIICMYALLAALELKDLGLAGGCLRRMEQSVLANKKSMRSRTLSFTICYHLERGDHAAALRDAQAALSATLDTGRPVAEAFVRIKRAYVFRALRLRAEAWAEVRRVEEVLRPLGDIYTLYLVRLTEASLLLDEGDRPGGLKALTDAFRIGKKKGYAMTLYSYWQPREMARLCAEALAAGIEVDYAKEVIRRHKLTPEGRTDMLKDWPWPVRIRTLGRFGIEVNEKPLTFTHKVQRKPLALLKAVIAMGGRDVNEEPLQDLLWPEAEGDAAHRAFKSAIFRLRRLLGNERAIEVKEGKVNLNPEVVWTDTRALESLAERVSQLHRDRRPDGDTDGLENLASLAIDLYQGDFLGTEEGSWIDRPRRRLRKRFTDTVSKLTALFRRAGRAEDAATLLGLLDAAAGRGVIKQESGRIRPQ